MKYFSIFSFIATLSANLFLQKGKTLEVANTTTLHCEEKIDKIVLRFTRKKSIDSVILCKSETYESNNYLADFFFHFKEIVTKSTDSKFVYWQNSSISLFLIFGICFRRLKKTQTQTHTLHVHHLNESAWYMVRPKQRRRLNECFCFASLCFLLFL